MSDVKDRTLKYELLVSYYLGEARFDKTEACRLVGYKADNLRNLQRQAVEIFQRSEVQEILRRHTRKIMITQAEILEEYTDLIRFNHKEEYQSVIESGSMVNAKAFDTMMRGKLKAISDMLKVTQNSLQEEINKIRSAFEEHRVQMPTVSDREREDIFRAQVDKQIMDEVMKELLNSEDNRQLLAEVEAEIENPAEYSPNE